jgi:hypothetical protein
LILPVVICLSQTKKLSTNSPSNAYTTIYAKMSQYSVFDELTEEDWKILHAAEENALNARAAALTNDEAASYFSQHSQPDPDRNDPSQMAEAQALREAGVVTLPVAQVPPPAAPAAVVAGAPPVDPRATFAKYQHPADAVDQLGDGLPASHQGHEFSRPLLTREVRWVNALTSLAIIELVEAMVAQSRIVPVVVENAKGTATTWLSRYKNTGGALSQVKVPEDSLAMKCLVAAHREITTRKGAGATSSSSEPVVARIPQTLTVSLLMWRYTHREPDDQGLCRRLVAGLQVSHLAEAYDDFDWPDVPEWNRELHELGKPGGKKLKRGQRLTDLPAPGFNPGHRVELTELESREVNASRQLCSRFALMWRNAHDWSIIPRAEAGPNNVIACPHAGMGFPCFGPHPTEAVGSHLRRTGEQFIEGADPVVYAQAEELERAHNAAREAEGKGKGKAGRVAQEEVEKKKRRITSAGQEKR